MSHSNGLVFGVYPFGVTGTVSGASTGPADDLRKLPKIIDDLRGQNEFLLRNYGRYFNEQSIPTVLSQIEFCMYSGLPWDFALCFAGDDNVDGWLNLIRETIEIYGTKLHTLQITNEPNLHHPPGDGVHANVMDALRRGVITAKQVARSRGATISIGFNAVPDFDPADNFWRQLKGFGREFVESLDYVGLNFYPDVFGPPIAPEHLPAAVETILRQFRATLLSTGIGPAIPLRITENGWPTSSTRSDSRQAQLLESIIRTIHRLREELNITHYELFSLRDADSASEDSSHHFGILRDDYSVKEAFAVYRNLIREFGTVARN